MNAINITLEDWAAWAPGLSSHEDWKQWANGEKRVASEGKPDVTFLPAMFRRRLSSLSKMSMRVAHDCSDQVGSLRTVFCSRHGELTRTVQLLQQLSDAELISPTGFSLSVHNTASGLFSIAHQNTLPTTAIAGGKDSFEAGFLEAAAVLRSGECEKILLVIADEPLPEPIDSFLQDDAISYAAAFLFSKAEKGQCISLSMGEDVQADSDAMPHALAFLKFLLEGEASLALAGERFTWRWTQNDIT